MCKSTSSNSYHITELFFIKELDQQVGSNAGEMWYSQQSSASRRARSERVTPSSLTISDPVLAKQQPSEPAHPKPSALNVLCSQELSCANSLSMDEDSLFQVDLSQVEDIGLLFTDAAHTVISRLNKGQ